MMDIIVSLTLLFAGIVVLVLIHVCIVMKAFGGGDEDGDQMQSIYIETTSNTMSMSREQVKRVPSFHYKEAERGASLVDCAVCLENFKVGKPCRLLPKCSHSFHVQCIDSWILKTPNLSNFGRFPNGSHGFDFDPRN